MFESWKKGYKPVIKKASSNSVTTFPNFMVMKSLIPKGLR